MKKTIMIVVLALTGMTKLSFACEEISPWKMEAAFGMADYAHVSTHDGQTAVGRMSLGYVIATLPFGQVGADVGIQSGNSMRLVLPEESIYALGGIPIEATMKPMLDMLIDFQTVPLASLPLSISVKGGVAYRSMQLDRESVPGVREFAPEIQTGMSYAINEKSSINIGYQYISGKKPELTVNPQTETGVLHYIPAQQAIMLGFSFNF
jgi:hypothetical protein